MISHQELSVQQVASYLLKQGDHYTSHTYRSLYWTSFEQFFDREIPSPECYSSCQQWDQQMVQDRLECDMDGECSSVVSASDSSDHENVDVSNNDNPNELTSQNGRNT